MKKITLTIFTISMLILAACGSNTSNTQQFNPNQSNNGASAELPLASKLVIGSFKLEGTDNAITADQAVDLLPLWQVYQQLSSSDTAAQEEITALAEQIQETMTSEQMQAINVMNLTQQDMFTLMQEQGIAGQGRGSFPQNGSNGPGGNNSFQPPAGGDGGFAGPPGGGPGGGGGGGFNNGQGLDPQQIATAQARRSQNGGGQFQFNGTPAPLIGALVEFLQKKVDS